ncbi:hypothetical protein J6590_002418 [Homalodisca vitripennis]|nr:hypothetical protein J6590_002418 [Homalodisca vitripennis]
MSLYTEAFNVDQMGRPEYICSCGKSYNYPSNLARHRKFECGKTPTLACPVCPAKFSRMCSLRRHQRCQHPVVQLDSFVFDSVT